MTRKKGGGRESDSQRVEQSPGLVSSPLPPEAAANPAAHDHTDLAYDVAGCRGCYLRGSRWPWPGGDPIQEKRILALEAELADARIAWGPERYEQVEARVKELEAFFCPQCGFAYEGTAACGPTHAIVAREREED